MTSPIQVTAETFEREVLGSSIQVFAVFCSNWCIACEAMVMAVEEYMAKHEGNTKFVRIDSESEKSLAEKYLIGVTPTLTIFKGGTLTEIVKGVLQLYEFLARRNENVSGYSTEIHRLTQS